MSYHVSGTNRKMKQYLIQTKKTYKDLNWDIQEDLTENIFQTCKRKDSQLKKQISEKTFVPLGDSNKLEQKLIVEQSQVVNFLKRRDSIRQHEQIQKQHSRKEIQKDLIKFRQSQQEQNLHEKQLELEKKNKKLQYFRRKLLNKMNQQIENIQLKLQNTQEQPLDKDQKIFKTVQEKFNRTQSSWTQNKINHSQSIKQYQNDKDELLDCLGLKYEQQPYDYKIKDYFNNLRQYNEKKVDQQQFFTKNQPYIKKNFISKWKFTDYKHDSKMNQQSIRDFYESEFMKKSETEINKKNKTFMTEYVRYLDDSQKFKINNIQLIKGNLRHLKKDFPKAEISFCGKQKCADNYQGIIDPNLINYQTVDVQELEIEGKSRFQIEKDHLENQIDKIEVSRLEQTIQKIQNFNKTEKQQEFTYQSSKKKLEFIV